MTKISRVFNTFIALVLIVPAFATLLVNTTKAQEVPVQSTVFSTATVLMDDMKRKDLYDFVTTIQNDNLWWIGVAETILVEEGDKNKVGEKYIQRGYFNGAPFDTTIEITAGKKGFFVVLKGSSPALSYEALYTFNTAPGNKARFTTISTVTGYGLSPEFLNQYNEVSFNNMLNVLGKTGTISAYAAVL